MNTITLTANTSRGIVAKLSRITNTDGVIMLNRETFYTCLSTLKDGESIGCIVRPMLDKTFYRMIEAEHGITVDWS